VYTKSQLAIPINFQNTKGFSQLVECINSSNSKTVFLHALSNKKQQIVSLLNNDIVTVWFIWGYDLYNMWQPFNQMLLEPITKAFINKKLKLKTKVFNLLFYKFKGYKLFRNSVRTYNTLYFNTVKQIDIAAPVLPTEMKYIHSLNKTIEYAPFNYVCLEHTLGEKLNQNVLNQSNILIGNSATQTNNHLDAFKALSHIDLKDRKVIVPLSYGGNESYLNKVLEQGKILLGDNFHPILDFMSLEEYNALILSCSHVIFNHIRQQAVGNILTMAYVGAKLFFNSKGLGYKYYKSIGLNVYTLKDLNYENLNNVLTEEEVCENKKILKSVYSLKNVQEKIKKLLQIVNQNSKNQE
jgi:hypothetical protein